MVFAPGEKPGSEPEEAKLQTTSRQIVQNAILRAVQQVSRESQSRRRDTRAGDTARGSLRPGAGESAKKHEK
ncbi:hypothetical protein R6Z07F_018247 [Ovis aries]|uniref:A-kinase anchor protein 7 RI-RII subunit-binding domain-containing protein n=2 Tax=Ovis TaxID=9935 RepID=A0A836CR11_SHEEP|nr:A-kinase anchor protein inhibitor 1 [Ovis aries]KAG5195670.1 hypothetical protein JEQ12_011965 [Ovis aries]KAI4564861.1 hypothetical protein MJG53_015873 [Ovis ammon polii x Ovis aries]